MKLRIAEKIFKHYLEKDYIYRIIHKHYGQHLIANEKEIKALKICKKFKDNEYWPFKIWKDKTIIMIIGG